MIDLSQAAVLGVAFCAIAFLFSSVGHGGASGYLALLSLAGLMSAAMVPVVLVLNILVAAIGLYMFWSEGHLRLRILLPFVIASVPAAFVGGLLHVEEAYLRLFLGVFLILAAARIFIIRGSTAPVTTVDRSVLWMVGLGSGSVLGLLSGMIGIGGGVFLSPLLLLLRWTDPKQTAAIASAFIVVNSCSGLAGHLTRGNLVPGPWLLLVTAVIIGGWLGSFAGAKRLTVPHLQTVMSVVLLLAGLKLVLPIL